MEGARVLVLNERDLRHPRAGGAEVHIWEVSRRLAAHGFETTVASCSFAGAPARERVEGVEVLRLGPLPLYYPRALWACRRETGRGRYDVVVEHLNKLPFLAPLYAAAPVVAVCHHLFGEAAFLQAPWPVAAGVWAAERLIPPCYRDVPFVAVSESTARDLAARGVRPRWLELVHNGIRQPALSPPPPSRRACRIAYLGRLEPYKRVDVLLRAAARLVPRHPALELVVIGRGQERERLERLAAELGLAERTRFAGFVSDDERDALLGASRVCVCPSAKEGWGITVIEANALGVPVVASDAPGLRDAVRDGRTGLLAPFGDVDAFAERIDLLLRDDALVDRLGAEARAWAREFDWDRAAAAMAACLRRARAEGRARRG